MPFSTLLIIKTNNIMINLLGLVHEVNNISFVTKHYVNKMLDSDNLTEEQRKGLQCLLENDKRLIDTIDVYFTECKKNLKK